MSRNDVTELLLELRSPSADHAAIRSQLYKAVYSELRRVAGAVMRSESPEHILQPTALVNEAYLKLVNDSRIEWRDRTHFLSTATRAMRQVLVDYARQRQSAKRGGNLQSIILSGAVGIGENRALEIIELNRVLDRLTTLSERTAQVVELRVFGGLRHREIATTLSISVRTVASEWSFARRWLARELRDGQET